MSTEKEDDQSGGFSLEGLSLEPVEERKTTVSAIDLVADLPLPEEKAPEAESALSVEPDASTDPAATAKKPVAAKKAPAPSEEKPAVRPPPAKDEADGAEQFFQPHARKAPQPEEVTPAASRSLDPRLMVGGGAAVVLMLVLAGWLFLGGDEPADSSTTGEVQAEAPQLPPDVATTKARMTALARAAKVWMIQFGAGYNPSQVTIARLKSDVGVQEAELSDGWGTPLRYEAKESGFAIHSAGPDKAFDTSDDLVEEETLPH